MKDLRDAKAGRCPDGGKCHHNCREDECFRVRYCCPFTGEYPGDVWPEEIKQKYPSDHWEGLL